MILEQKTADVVVIGQDTSKKAKISENKLAKLQYLLTKGLYKDPITAVIAEWTNNGIDSVVQAGKNPVENPVLVEIGKDNKGQFTFRVVDKGIGLDDRDFEDICMNYLESTKENDNDTIGHFGIGMKSFLSLERSATFTCVKNGIMRKYLVYEGPEFVNYDLIMETATTEENGVTAELTINGWYEYNQFVEKAKSKLAYYDTAVLLVDGLLVPNEIFRNDLIQYSSLIRSSQMHISLKDVYYPIDWDALGIKPIEVPVAIRMHLKDGIKPTPSRESYISNESTKQLLLKKIEEVAEWFVNKYNEGVRHCKNFIEAYPFIGQSIYMVKFGDKDFRINPLTSYSKIKINEVKIDGICLWSPLDYKNKRDELFDSYTIAGYINRSGNMKMKAERIGVGIGSHVLGGGDTVLVKDNFRGNIKEYLKSKYYANTLFVRDNGYKRRLGKVKEWGPNGQLVIDTQGYRTILGLNGKPKQTWRARIKEWNFVVSSIVSTFKDERDVEDDPQYHEWLEQKRERQKAARLKGGTYKGLFKQTGDVTLAYSYERYGNIHFGKKAYPIKELGNNKFLTVLLTEEDNLDLAKGIIKMIRNKKVFFALVGKKEKKKIPDYFQFINFKDFMSRDCKPFMRLASAIKFQEALDDYEEIKVYKNAVFANILKSLNEDADKLDTYVDQNLEHICDEVRNMIIDVADEHKLYDQTLWDVYTRFKKELKKYDFINLIAVPKNTNHEQTRRYETLINQILLFRKKFYNDLPEGTKIVFEAPDTNKKEDYELV